MLVPAAWAATLVLDIGGATEKTYSDFMTKLRTEAKGKDPMYVGLSMMPKPTKPPTYLLVELKVSKDMSITLSLSRNDLYVVGYSDMYKGKCRYHVFPDHDSKKPPYEQHSLCDKAKDAIRKPIGYVSSYTEIERKAKVRNRKEIGLGVNKLKTLIPKVYGSESKDYQDEAKFLLVAIQTIAEAARFPYIEKIAETAANPDDTAICLENNWSKISKEIYNQFKGNPQTPAKDVTVRTCKNLKGINQVQKYITLLSYQGTSRQQLTKRNVVSVLSICS